MFHMTMPCSDASFTLGSATSLCWDAPYLLCISWRAGDGTLLTRTLHFWKLTHNKTLCVCFTCTQAHAHTKHCWSWQSVETHQPNTQGPEYGPQDCEKQLSPKRNPVRTSSWYRIGWQNNTARASSELRVSYTTIREALKPLLRMVKTNTSISHQYFPCAETKDLQL